MVKDKKNVRNWHRGDICLTCNNSCHTCKCYEDKDYSGLLFFFSAFGVTTMIIWFIYLICSSIG